MNTNPGSLSMAARLWLLGERAIAGLDGLKPLALLIARGYVASVFFRAGLVKLSDWDVTLALFSDEYHVPFLNPSFAAYLATFGETCLPVLLVLGLFGRFAAAGLTVLNAVAVVSLMMVADAALQQHVFWGSLLIGLVLWGPGPWSIDRWLIPRLRRRVLGGDMAMPAAKAGEGYTAAGISARP